MSYYDYNTLTRLINQLKAKKVKTGKLYHAMTLVAKQCDENIKIDDFLRQYNITNNSPIDIDIKTLNRFNFPHDFIKLIRSKFIDDVRATLGGVDLLPEFLLIMAASYIVLFFSKKKHQDDIVHEVKSSISIPEDNNRDDKAFNFNDSNTEVLFKALTLSLVLKGTELKNNKSEFSLSETRSLLEKASYFLCTSQIKMHEIQQELSLDDGAIDRESEQQVLIVLHFDHTKEPNIFVNKFELIQYLMRCNDSTIFKMDNMQTLLKIGGLSKLGYIRT